MATRGHILMDLDSLDEATPQAMLLKMCHRRYVLHKGSLWQGEWRNVNLKPGKEKAAEPRPMIMKGQFGIALISFLALLFVIVPVLLFTRANWLLQRVPWILTACGVLIKLFWSQLDIGVRLMEPYYILARRNALPQILALDYTGDTPFHLPVRAFHKKHGILFAVGINSIFVEILTVCLSSFGLKGNQFLRRRAPTSSLIDNHLSTLEAEDAETFISFWITFILSLAILLSLSVTAMLVYHRRCHAYLPRQPGTIASMLAFTHRSKFLYNLVDKEALSTDEVVKELEDSGKLFGFGWYQGRDGKSHCGIDEEPLLRNYKPNTSPWKDAD
jgi:hypothetical protein